MVGVIAAHNALKLRKLTDHAGREIGLGEQARAACGVRIALGEILARNPRRQIADTLSLLTQRTHPFVEEHVFKARQIILKRCLQILFPEELGVGEARGEHLGIAVGDQLAAIGRRDVRGADEIGRERAVGIVEHEIFLVGAHGELDHLARDLKKFRIEAPKQRHRPFGKARIFGDQPLILDQRQPCGAGSGGRALGDDAAAFGRVDDDMAGAQLGGIIIGIADGDAARMVEPVADRVGARDNAVDLERDDIVAEQRDDTLKRAHPAQAFGGRRRRAPAHRFRPGKGADDRRDRLCNHLGGRAARLFDHREQDDVALIVRALDKLFARQSGGLQETLQRLFGRIGTGAFAFLAHRLGFKREAARDQRHAARGDEAFDGCGLETGLADLFREKTGKISRRLFLHARRDFLRQQLEKKIRHYAAHPFFSIHAAHAPFARSRTRPIYA